MGCGPLINIRRRLRRSAEEERGAMNSERSSSRTVGSDEPIAGQTDRASGQAEVASILSYLIRSGQLRMLPSHLLNDDGEDDDEEAMDDEECFMPDRTPQVDRCPDTSAMDTSEIKVEIQSRIGQIGQARRTKASCVSMSRLVQQREQGLLRSDGFSGVDQRSINCCFLPNKKQTVVKLQSKAFCGTYSQSGDIFMSACQDRIIRIYDTRQGNFKQFNSIQALDVGWSVLDTAFSPDGNYVVYSSWSNYLHLCNIYGEHATQTALCLNPETEHSFCIFSIGFSQDNKEILGGANDRCLYVYDRESNQRTLRIEAHEDDVNAVAFADDSSQILFSGSDDGLCKIWDRRALNEEDPKPVGVLAGHHDGITFIDSKLDGRYLISNCKDQTIKLWDIRRLSPKQVQEATRREVSRQNWDYRWQQVPRKVSMQRRKIEGDSSLMTYRGHCVLNTLVRCRFSPLASTGQRYIYTGCATGAVIVYDLLTGRLVTKLVGHKSCVRDVSWHPFENTIMSTSWDYSVGRWTYVSPPDRDDMEKGVAPSKESGGGGASPKAKPKTTARYQLRCNRTSNI